MPANAGCWGFLLALCALGTLPAARAEDETPAWQPAAAKQGVQAALLDTRSFTVPHERFVALDAAWLWADRTLRFSRDPQGALQVEITHPGEDRTTHEALRTTPALLRLEALGRPYALSICEDGARGGVWIASAYGVAFAWGREHGTLVDSDLDGILGSPGDGYVAPASRTVAPWSGEAWTRKTAVRLRVGAGGTWEARPLRMPHPDRQDHAAAWRFLQWRRQQCGLLPIGYRADLEPALRLHADYCVENDYRGHEEVRGRKAFSEAGAGAGRRSVLGYSIRTLSQGMEQQLGTLYHRNALLQPALTHTALVLHRGVFAADVRAAADGPLGDCVLLVPPHGMQDVDRHFSAGGESPMPVAGTLAALANLGPAVGLFARSLERSEALDERPTLTVTRLVGRARRPGASFRLDLYYPGNVPHPSVPAHNFGNVALTPPRPLEARTTYRCRIRVTLPAGTRVPPPYGRVLETEWEFTTGR